MKLAGRLGPRALLQGVVLRGAAVPAVALLSRTLCTRGWGWLSPSSSLLKRGPVSNPSTVTTLREAGGYRMWEQSCPEVDLGLHTLSAAGGLWVL